MANIYKNIRSAAKMKASPAKQTDDELNWKAVNDGKEYYTTHGGKKIKVSLEKAQKFTPGSDAIYDTGKSLAGLTKKQLDWRKAEIEKLGGLEQYHIKYGDKTKGKLKKAAVADKTEDFYQYKKLKEEEKKIIPAEVETTTTPDTQDYNMGYWDSVDVNMSEAAQRRGTKRKSNRADKDIKTYEQGRKGFLGIGKKESGNLTANVISAYENKGIIDRNRFTYNDTPSGIVDDPLTEDVDESITRGKKITGEVGGNQIVSETMRDRANSLSMNKYGSAKDKYGPVKPGTSSEIETKPETEIITDEDVLSTSKDAVDVSTLSAVEKAIAAAGNVPIDKNLINKNKPAYKVKSSGILKKGHQRGAGY